MLDYLDDIESDFSAIHRVHDIHALTARRFFTWAVRLPAYPGVMQLRAQAELAQDQPQQQGHVPAPVAHVPPELNAGFRGDGFQYPPVFQNLTPKGGGTDGA